MKCYSCIFLFVLFSSMNLFSQEKFRQHTVTKGETISEIAQKYNINPSEIYELNPDAVNGIKLKSILLIPGKTQKNSTVSIPVITNKTSENTHEVLPKETLYGITKQYKISLEDLYKINPNLEKEGLKIGQIIRVSSNDLAGAKSPENKIEVEKNVFLEKKAPKEEIITASRNQDKIEGTTELIKYEVQPKESLYSISKLYNVTVSDLQKANPELGNKSLQVGQKINIPGNSQVNSSLVAEKKEVKIEKDIQVSTPPVIVKEDQQTEKSVVIVSESKLENSNNTIEGKHEVQSKESLYSIAKLHNITLSDLQKANPELGNKSLRVGQKINIPVKSEANLSLVAEKKEVKTEKEIPVSTPSVLVKNDQYTEKSVAAVSESKLENSNNTAEGKYEVQPKESLYSIAKLHNITLSELQKANPELGSKSLKVGQKINIPVKSEVNSTRITEIKAQETGKTIQVASQSTVENNTVKIEYTHQVLPKETKYGIAKNYGISVSELEKQNPNIAKKLLVGSMLKINSSKLIEKAVEVQNAINLETEYVKEKFDDSNINVAHDEFFIDQLILKASENIGIRYRSGGTTKDGFDCSGLMCYTFGDSDVKLPRSSMEMASFGSKIDTQSAKKGDLIFFRTGGRDRINHVGMVVEVIDDEIKFIHSSSHGVIISSTKETYYEKRVVQVNRVL